MTNQSTLAIGCDHAGIGLKKLIMGHLNALALNNYKDFGTFDDKSVDYPDYAEKVCKAVINGEFSKGILICGTGLGMSIAANRFKGIRAALCHDSFTAKMSRRHNDANILVLGANVTAAAFALDILETWLNTAFDGGRHERRIVKLDNIFL